MLRHKLIERHQKTPKVPPIIFPNPIPIQVIIAQFLDNVSSGLRTGSAAKPPSFAAQTERLYRDISELICTEFDACLPLVLLYDDERVDLYGKLAERYPGAAGVYCSQDALQAIPWHTLLGAEHLVRFLIHLPQIAFVAASNSVQNERELVGDRIASTIVPVVEDLLEYVANHIDVLCS